ncbi:hypothetical protein PCL_12916 [Purpureocillium lilacinum]|uniref:Uncharacterized protein n=1 Tax=Purpureocillium lilacinum TaxID=33203 RepID=A0A2U3E7R4_PURLI|nr:hypothetical protein Purlil1_6140 [Purpureocillium lilacinum]PWI70517.1 hypothetical protein PCL_12916 [Purpureocillium lilacinum]
MAEKARSDLASPSRQHETWRNDVEGHSTSTCGGGDRPGCTSTTRSDDATTGRTRRGAHTPLRRGCDRSERGIQSRIVRSRASIGALEAASPRALSAVVSHTGRGRLATAARADRVRRRVTQDGGRAWRGHPADGRRGEVGLRGVGEQNAALRTQCASSWTSMELQAWNGSSSDTAVHHLYRSGRVTLPSREKAAQLPAPHHLGINSGRNDRLYRNPHAIEAHVVHTHLLILWLAMVFAVSSVSTVWPELT